MSTRVLLLLHGLGDDGSELASAKESLTRPGLHVVVPRAPVPYEDLGGYSWHDTDTPDVIGSFERGLDVIVGMLAAACADVGALVESSIVGGFSQGAVMALGLACSKRTPNIAGLILMSLGYLPPLAPEQMSLAKAPPTLVQHGTDDDPVLGQNAAWMLEQHGVPVLWQEQRRAHPMTDASLRDAGVWLDRFLSGEQPAGQVPATQGVPEWLEDPGARWVFRAWLPAGD